MRHLEPIVIEAPAAPPLDRLLASIVDALVCGVIGSICAALHMPIGFLATVLYYTVMTKNGGQTLGKKAFGLKVVSVTDEDLTYRQLFLREGLGRFLCVITFLSGYVAILFREDRRGFHDLVAKTRVVRIRQAEEGMPAWQMLAASLSVIVALILGAAYVLLMTPFPLQQMAKSAALQGTEISGISGSLLHGFSIEKMASADQDNPFELSNVHLSGDLKSYFKTRRIVINDFSVGGGKLKVHFNRSATQGVKDGKDEKDPAAKQMRVFVPASKLAVEIKRLDIQNLELQMPLDEGPVHLQSFVVEDMVYEHQELNVGKLALKSDGLDFEIGSLQLSTEQFKLSELAQATLKPRFFSKYIKKDFKVELIGEGKIKTRKVENLYLAGCDRRLQVRTAGADDLKIQSYGFSPESCLGQPSPIENVNVTMQGASLKELMQLNGGSFNIGPAVFQFQNPQLFSYRRGDQVFSLVPNAISLLMNNSTFRMMVADSTHVNLEEWLADLYYSKAYAILSPEESQKVTSDKAFFAFAKYGDQQVQGAVNMPLATSEQQRRILRLEEMLKQSCAEGAQNACDAIKKLADARRDRQPATAPSAAATK